MEVDNGDIGESVNVGSVAPEKVASGVVKINGSTVEEFTQVSWENLCF